MHYVGRAERIQERVKNLRTHACPPFKLMLNSGTGNITQQISSIFDGIANLKADTFFFAITGSTIGKCLDTRREAEAENKISARLGEICQMFHPKPVWYRTTDSDMDLVMKILPPQIPSETGYPVPRGLSLALRFPRLLEFELRVVFGLCAKGVSNLGIKFPMVSSPNELQKVQETIDGMGVSRNTGLGIGITIETPSAALRSKEFIPYGLRFTTVGINDLAAIVQREDREYLSGTDEDFLSNPEILQLVKSAADPLVSAGIDCILSGLGEPPSETALQCGQRFFSGIAVSITDSIRISQLRDRIRGLENE
jgi:pyruvate,water dikinase